MDVRRIGIWMVAVGGGALSIGLVLDAIDNADDPSRAAKEGIFDLSSFPHALFFGGICVAILGLFAILFGGRLYEHTDRVTVGRRMAQVGVPIAAVVLIIGAAAFAGNSGLSEGNDERTVSTEPASSSSDAQTATDDHSAEHDMSQMAPGEEHADEHAAGEHDMAGMGTVIEGTATGDSPCEVAQPTPASPGQVGAGGGGSSEGVIGEHGHRGMVQQEPLTQEQRTELQSQMEAARSVAVTYPTVAAAEAGGYHKSTPYVPCIGAHYTNFGLVGSFDPAKPSELLFDGTNPDSKIVGLSYLVYNKGGAPEGFAGPNDHFHQHNANGGLCLQGGLVVGGEEVSPEECAQRGGKKQELTDIWMEHAWIVPGFECSWGVFAGECPELGGRTGGTAWDAPAPAESTASN
ncbi:MAG TPA: hypothetical protein VFX21_06340 [Acidimicrobiia bacterium]|nr:hypothetical protein [Acidimicrobiia bacterium]